MALLRQQEAREAVSLLGVEVLIPLPLRDVKSEENKLHFKNDFKETLRRFKPEEIYIPHPEIDKHPTHQVVSKLVLDGLNELSDNDNLQHARIWCYEVWTPFSVYDRIEDISQYINLKVRAIEAHKSQLEYKNYTQRIIGLNRYRAVFDERHGVPKMQYTEVFIELKF